MGAGGLGRAPPPMHPSAHDIAMPDVAGLAAAVGQRARHAEHIGLVSFRLAIPWADASADVTCWTVQPEPGKGRASGDLPQRGAMCEGRARASERGNSLTRRTR